MIKYEVRKTRNWIFGGRNSWKKYVVLGYEEFSNAENPDPVQCRYFEDLQEAEAYKRMLEEGR